jgi:hypothetical protein
MMPSLTACIAMELCQPVPFAPVGGPNPLL